MTEHIADLLPARWRAIIYAVLAVIVPTTTLLVTLLSDGWQMADLPLILAAAASSAGFTLAHGNTPD